MLNTKEGLDGTLSIHIDMFPIAATDYKDILKELSFFTDSEKAEMRSRIYDFELNPKSRNGGSALKKKIENVAIAKRELLKFIQDIHDMLEPKERSRTSVKEAEALSEQRSINNTAETYRKAFKDEKLLRAFATTMLGDVEGDYTFEELPVVLATKQITGILQSIS